jgi:hypothetical protein
MPRHVAPQEADPEPTGRTPPRGRPTAPGRPADPSRDRPPYGRQLLDRQPMGQQAPREPHWSAGPEESAQDRPATPTEPAARAGGPDDARSRRGESRLRDRPVDPAARPRLDPGAMGSRLPCRLPGGSAQGVGREPAGARGPGQGTRRGLDPSVVRWRLVAHQKRLAVERRRSSS